MKKLIILTVGLFIQSLLYGQPNKKCVGMNSQFNKDDTTHTFSVYAENLDSVRQRLINYWGTPSMNSYGSIEWKGKEVINLGNGLEIHLIDWICSNKNKHMKCESFKSEKDKIRRIRELKQNQYRSILISIKSKDGKNIINTNAKAQQVVELLEAICACE